MVLPEGEIIRPLTCIFTNLIQMYNYRSCSTLFTLPIHVNGESIVNKDTYNLLKGISNHRQLMRGSFA